VNEAVVALHNLAFLGGEAVKAIIAAGAVSPLVALLSCGPESEAAEGAAGVLHNLSCDSEGSNAIIGEGAIPLLVALLSGGPDSEAADTAAQVLHNLTCYGDEARKAIVEAGAVPPLVALLSGGPGPAAAQNAAEALRNLAFGTNSTPVLEEVARTETDCSSWLLLRAKLRECASARLQAAEEGTAVAALEHAITLAAAVQVDPAALDRARVRLRELNDDAERQERRESFGLGSLELPAEFICPITMDKMRGVPPPPLPPTALAHRRHTRAPLAPQTRWWRPTATHTSGRPSTRCSATATA